jgi:hypothetical protein
VLQILLISVQLDEGTDSDILMYFTAECLNQYLLVLSYPGYDNSRYLPDQSLTPAIITIRCTTTSLDRANAMRFTIRLGELNPPKTLSIYAPFGAGICNTLCTANTFLHYCWYYHIKICITAGITFLFFVIPSVSTSPDLSYYKSAKKAITSSDTSSQELSGTSPKHVA